VIDAVLTNAVLPMASEQFLTLVMNGETAQHAILDAKDGEFVFNFR